ncbi:MAG: UDP-N-acetylmuramoyl-tripeptide--D-alanyl-D-alanine ligase, partial [Synechococcus sp. ELA619]
MTIQLSRLIERWGAPLDGPALDPGQDLGPVSTASRQIRPGSLFVPLVGERFDGHGFLAEAARLGAQAALVQRDRAELVPAGLACWLVDDTLAAYQELALLWRRQLAAPVLAVTGSAGKTTTRELLRAVLATTGPVWASQGNENNDIGVPLTLFQATAEHRAVVVEMGMRGLGEIERLSRCCEPDLAVITNLGTAHIGRLGSREAIGQAKCEITAALKPEGLVVIPAGDPLLDSSLAAVWGGRVLRVALAGEGFEAQADWVGQLDSSRQTLTVGEAVIPLPLPGAHNARNLLLALAAAASLGMPLDPHQALELALPGGRSRRLRLGAIELLDETYNASPEATLAALALLAGSAPGTAAPGTPGQAVDRGQPLAGRKFAVLGTMLELGEQSLGLHRQVAERALALGLDGLVIVDGGAEGQVMAAAAQGLPRLALVASPEEAAQELVAWLEPGDQVLLKASRGVALERAIP